jgi:pimeloyl-ACP methyl ester carboxylesterase
MVAKTNQPELNRRAVIRTALAATAAGVGAAILPAGPAIRPAHAQAQARKPTFVLVAGAWHGGWCWQRITPLLRAAGHDVHAPSLTGLGDREHLASRSVSLNTHITDVANLLLMEDLKDVVLVGHSYAGFVVTGVADRSPARIRTLVYLDAFVPEDGKSLADYVLPDRRAAFEQTGKEKGFYDPFPLAPFGVTKPEDVAFAQPRLRPQPYLTFTQPLKMKGPLNKPRVYVRATEPSYPQFEGLAQQLKTDPNWKYAEVTGGHDCMITNPRGLADALLKLA